MADDKKVKKTKKKAAEEAPPAEAPPAEAPAPAPVKKASTRASQKAKRTGSNVYSMFSEKQVKDFKECFNMMDNDKDGVISKNDLRATYDVMGRMANEKELDDMLNEAPGALNFTALLTMFANKMSGSVDEDEVIIGAFKSFDDDGKIDSEKLRHALMTWGDKFSANEVDDAFESMVIDNQGRIDTGKLIALLCASAEEEEEEEA